MEKTSRATPGRRKDVVMKVHACVVMDSEVLSDYDDFDEMYDEDYAKNDDDEMRDEEVKIEKLFDQVCLCEGVCPHMKN